MSLACFNPCFNGINIQTRKVHQDKWGVTGFNPCFNGINIQTTHWHSPSLHQAGFNPCFNGINIQTSWPDNIRCALPRVSILVLMESTFRLSWYEKCRTMKRCFNPCFNGINIQTELPFLDVLRYMSFNPCFNGINIQTPLLPYLQVFQYLHKNYSLSKHTFSQSKQTCFW